MKLLVIAVDDALLPRVLETLQSLDIDVTLEDEQDEDPCGVCPTCVAAATRHRLN